MRIGWPDVELGDLIDIKHGFAFKGSFFRDEPQGDILLTPQNFAIGGGFKGDKFKYYEGSTPEDFILHKGDLLVTMTDLSKQSDTLGYPAFVPANADGCRFLHNQRLGKVVPKNNTEGDLRYIYYLMCSDAYRDEVLASATGTTVKHTSPSRIKKFRFSLPPLPVQRAIAHILGTLDDKIELNRRMSQTLEEMARALFKSWFVNFDPVRAKAALKQHALGDHSPLAREPSGNGAAAVGEWTVERARAYLAGMNPQIVALFPDRLVPSELGEIPEGWEVRGLDEIADFTNGVALQRFPPEGDEWLPVIKIAEMRRGYTAKTGRSSANLDPRYIVEDGDLLFSWSGSLELIFWAHGRGALNQHLFKVTSDEFPQWFYWGWIREHLDDFRSIAADKATTMGHIQRHHLTDARVAVPPPRVIVSAEKLIGALVDQHVGYAIQSRALAAQRDALLPELVSGKVGRGAVT